MTAPRLNEPVAVPPQRAGAPRPAAFPVRISVELTNHCNQRCTLCPRLGFTRPLGFMAREVFERVAQECAQHPTRLWLHFLGEPLLHRELIEMIRFAKRVGVQEVGLSTNGISLRGRLADAIMDSGLDRLECSIDADDAAGYLAMRGRDHFERVTTNVREFLVRKQAMGRERPITSIQVMRTPRAESILDRLIESWRDALGPRDFVMTIVPATFAGTIATPVVATGARIPCKWLFSSLMVMQDGTVTMCGADWDACAPLGNVREQSIAEIWRGAELTRRRQAHLDGRYESLAICAGCEDWRLADGAGYVNVLAQADAGRTAYAAASADAAADPELR